MSFENSISRLWDSWRVRAPNPPGHSELRWRRIVNVMTAASPPVVIEVAGTRQVVLGCDHGEITADDNGCLWFESQLVSFAQAVLATRANCQCFGRGSWLPPTRPEHVSIEELRLFATDEPDDGLDHMRPAVTPGRAVSLAASRVFETAIPTDHGSLAQDWRMVRWWWIQRQLGLLAADDS